MLFRKKYDISQYSKLEKEIYKKFESFSKTNFSEFEDKSEMTNLIFKFENSLKILKLTDSKESDFWIDIFKFILQFDTNLFKFIKSNYSLNIGNAERILYLISTGFKNLLTHEVDFNSVIVQIQSNEFKTSIKNTCSDLKKVVINILHNKKSIKREKYTEFEYAQIMNIYDKLLIEYETLLRLTNLNTFDKKIIKSQDSTFIIGI